MRLRKQFTGLLSPMMIGGRFRRFGELLQGAIVPHPGRPLRVPTIARGPDRHMWRWRVS
jgi:hypothetical protein